MCPKVLLLYNHNILMHVGVCAGVAHAISGGNFGPGVGPINAYGLNCIGNETSLLNCSSRAVPFFCSHFSDVGVLCTRERFLTVHANIQTKYMYVLI